MIADIRAKLNTKLGEMQNIKQAFNYMPNEFTQYPAATIELKAGEGEFRSQAYNQHETAFNIKIFTEKGTNFSSQNAERISVEVMDEIRTALDMDVTLSGTVKFVKAIDFNASYVDAGIAMRLLNIDVSAIELTTTQT